MTRIHRALLPGLIVLTTACAGSTINSGVGDTLFERAPYYAGRLVTADTIPIGHLPVSYQRGATQSELFDPKASAGSAIDQLLRDMNAFVDSLGWSRPIHVTQAIKGTAPNVYFGCEVDTLNECHMPDRGLLNRGGPEMKLSVARPSGSWVNGFRPVLDSAGVERALLLTLEIGEYWPRQTNLRGSKEVELGTTYAVSLPWLTALDKPVMVLQITGALVDRDGRAIRIGAEGLLAKRTNIVLSGLGVQALISDEDVEQVRSARRDDLPGKPLVWQAALKQLMHELSGQR